MQSRVSRKLLGGHHIPARWEPATWKEGRALITAVLERALFDLLRPSYLSKDDQRSLETRRKIEAKVAHAQAVWDDGKRSGLSSPEFAVSRGYDIAKTQYLLQYIRKVATCDPRRKYPSAWEWVFNNAECPWSFTWCLGQLWGDPYPIREKLREVVRNFRKNLREKESDDIKQNGNGV